MSIANQLESKLMKQVFGNTSFALNTSFWLTLHTGDPGETATASKLSNHSSLTMEMANTPTSTVANSTTVTFTASTTGTITHVSINSACTSADIASGTALWSGALTASKTIANVGDQIQLASGALVITLS